MSERVKHSLSETNPPITDLVRRVGQQTEKMDLWSQNGSPEHTAQLLADEVDELREQINESMVTGEVTPLAMELGDIGYLFLKLCYDVGVNPADAIQIKILRNDLKYTTDLNSNGNYEDSRQKSKDLWSSLGGDVAFSHAYLDWMGKILDEKEEQETQQTIIYESPLTGNDYY